MKTFHAIPCLLFAVASLASCTDDDDILEPPPGDAAVDHTTDGGALSEAGDAAVGDATGIDSTTASDAGEAGDDDASSDGSAAEGAAADAASDSAVGDAAAIETGPGGDGGLVLGGDGSSADGTFHLSAVTGANILSSSDVRPECSIAATGGVAGNYLLTCEERGGAAGPCRTLEIEFRINPSSGPRDGDVYTAVIQASPTAINQAVVRYRESIDCTAATTNGWIQAAPGGDLTVDIGGDTATVFTLHAVAMGPAPRGVLNQNAQGTFTLSGNGSASGSFQ